MASLSEWFQGHLGGLGDVAYIAKEGSEHFISGGDDAIVKVRNASTMQMKDGDGEITIHEKCVRAVATSRDGSHFATGGEDQIVKLFSYPSLECKGTVTRFALPVQRPTGPLTPRNFELSFPETPSEPASHCSYRLIHLNSILRSQVNALAFSPDSTLLAAAGEDDTIRCEPQPLRAPLPPWRISSRHPSHCLAHLQAH